MFCPVAFVALARQARGCLSFSLEGTPTGRPLRTPVKRTRAGRGSSGDEPRAYSPADCCGEVALRTVEGVASENHAFAQRTSEFLDRAMHISAFHSWSTSRNRYVATAVRRERDVNARAAERHGRTSSIAQGRTA